MILHRSQSYVWGIWSTPWKLINTSIIAYAYHLWTSLGNSKVTIHVAYGRYFQPQVWVFPSRSQCSGIVAKVMYCKMLSKGAQVHLKALRLKHVRGPREELDDHHHQMILGINHWSKVIRHNSRTTWIWQTINLNLQILDLRSNKKTRLWYREYTKPFKYMVSFQENPLN